MAKSIGDHAGRKCFAKHERKLQMFNFRVGIVVFALGCVVGKDVMDGYDS